MMTSRNRDVVAFLFKKPQCWSFPPCSQLRRCSSPFVFLTNKISPLSKMPKGPFLSSPLLSPFILIPLSAFEPPRFLPLQHQNPLHQHGNHTPHYFSCTRGQLTPFSFQFASPPRIHMDSWWDARNPNQDLKWTHNISQNRSGAYEPEPCRIWAPKLLELVFYLSWLNEPAEPAEPDAKPVKTMAKNFENLTKCF